MKFLKTIGIVFLIAVVTVCIYSVFFKNKNPLTLCITPTCPTPTCPTPTCPTPTCPIPTCPTPTCPIPTCPTHTCPIPTCPTHTCPIPTCPIPTCPTPTCPINPKVLTLTYLIAAESPSEIENQFFILNEGENIKLTNDKTLATKVSLVIDNFGKQMNVSSFPIYKMKINNKYVTVKRKTSNLTNPDDNLISLTDEFYFNSISNLLPNANPTGSLFLDANFILSAYFAKDSSDELVAQYSNGIFFDTSDNDTDIKIKVMEN